MPFFLSADAPIKTCNPKKYRATNVLLIVLCIPLIYIVAYSHPIALCDFATMTDTCLDAHVLTLLLGATIFYQVFGYTTNLVGVKLIAPVFGFLSIILVASAYFL